MPLRTQKLDVATGRREPSMILGPAELTGALRIGQVAISDDGKTHAFSVNRMASHLFLVGGAR